ncbi:hypothetical protein VTN00DRAFT_3383 [Thermoascus crustaceus]|uniref:uncharacterized protein n=1 Tax=Thermoascus crustaceus TaxID=5088 RepID=UPI0037428ED0
MMPFGLTNGSATFQHYVNDLFLDYLDQFMTVFINDILVYSENELEHKEHVIKILNRLREAGLQADIKKCEFHVTWTKYLGFIVGTNGIEVDPEKVLVIRDWEPPITVKGVQSFLGFCNFYWQFIQDYSCIARPLFNLTQKDMPFNFNSQCLQAFKELKKKLISTPVLIHYSPH